MDFSMTCKAYMMLFITLFLVGCSSIKPIHLACDFVGGATENAVKRHENNTDSNVTQHQGNSDILEGLLNAVSGLLTRTINNNNKSECT